MQKSGNQQSSHFIPRGSRQQAPRERGTAERVRKEAEGGQYVVPRGGGFSRVLEGHRRFDQEDRDGVVGGAGGGPCADGRVEECEAPHVCEGEEGLDRECLGEGCGCGAPRVQKGRCRGGEGLGGCGVGCEPRFEVGDDGTCEELFDL